MQGKNYFFDFFFFFFFFFFCACAIPDVVNVGQGEMLDEVQKHCNRVVSV
jgi:hypothetical protein